MNVSIKSDLVAALPVSRTGSAVLNFQCHVYPGPVLPHSGGSGGIPESSTTLQERENPAARTSDSEQRSDIRTAAAQVGLKKR